MWIPADAEELERLVRDGSLEETATLDFKREISNKSLDIAVDVASMANNGGVLIYGVGEDRHKRPVVLNALALAGQPERVSAIVRSGISEPPQIEIRGLERASDPSTGYLVVIIPASERAPHMVTAGKENRFYGRTAKENCILAEGEVARLYERRKRWEIDREALLDVVVKAAPLEPNPNMGYLHLVIRPVVENPRLVQVAAEARSERQLIQELVDLARRPEVFDRCFSPSFEVGEIRNTPHGWCVFLHDQPTQRGPRDPSGVLDLQLRFDGGGSLFCGRAAERHQGVLTIFEKGLAETTVRFLVIFSELFRRSAYWGPVDLGLALTGIGGAISYERGATLGSPHWACHPFAEASYLQTTRVQASLLTDDPRSVARSLAARLFHAISGGSPDPFAP